MADFRWLIEAPGARYLAVRRLKISDDFEWTTDHDKALAFPSKDQADALMMAVRQMDRMYAGGVLFAFEVTLGNAAAVEHGWLVPAQGSLACDTEMAFIEACDEAACAHDNEALLEAIADLKLAAQCAWKPIEAVPARADAEAMLLYFPPTVTGAHKQSTLPAMYRTGHPDDFPNRKPSHFMLVGAPSFPSTDGSAL